MTDWELIERYAAHRDDRAFTELVRRHLGFVHACARRQVGPVHADDVAQSVFLVLARKAATLRANVVLSSWLFRTTGFVVAQWKREEARRRRREHEAVAMDYLPDSSTPAPIPSGSLSATTDHRLDEALARLSESDRRYLLTRYVEGQDFPDIATRFGVSEPAARKRVTRAVERLRTDLLRQGVTTSTIALAALLGEPRAQALPAALTERIATVLTQPASPSIIRIAEQALRDWTLHAWRQAARFLAITGAAALLLVTSGSWVLSDRRDSTSSPASAVAAPVPGTSLLAGMRARREAAVNSTIRGPGLALTAVAAESGDPISSTRFEVTRLAQAGIARVESFTSDDHGRVWIPVPTPDFDQLKVHVSAAGFTTVTLDWLPHEFASDPLPYQVGLRPGQSFSGRVVDARRVPIEGVKIVLSYASGFEEGRREEAGSSVRLETDAAGTFATDQIPILTTPNDDPSFDRFRGTELPLGIMIRHPDYRPRYFPLSAAAIAEQPVVLVLRPGATLRGKVTGLDGQPISGARVQLSNDPAAEDIATSGEDGRFLLNQVPASDLMFLVSAPGRLPYHGFIPSAEEEASQDRMRADAKARGFIVPPDFSPTSGSHRRHWVEATEGGPAAGFEVEVTLHPLPQGTSPPEPLSSDETDREAVRIVGRVIDAETSDPIPRFKVSKLLRNPDRISFLGEGRDGHFDWTLPRHRLAGATLQASADGYMPISAMEPPSNPEASEWHLQFRLSTTTEISGWIELPDGRPAVGAWVITVDESMPVPSEYSLESGKLPRGTHHAIANELGRFLVRRTSTSRALVALHAEGCVRLPLQHGTNTVVRLEPRAVVEGRLESGGAPCADEEVRLAPKPSSKGMFEFQSVVRTDSQGRFKFNRVPPGEHTVFARDARSTVRVFNGRSAPVQLTRGGSESAHR